MSESIIETNRKKELASRCLGLHIEVETLTPDVQRAEITWRKDFVADKQTLRDLVRGIYQTAEYSKNSPEERRSKQKDFLEFMRSVLCECEKA